MAGEGLEAELVNELDEAGLVWGNPLAAQLNEVLHAVRVLDLAVPGAATDALAGLEDGDAQPLLLECVGCHEAGGAGADDDDVALDDGIVGWDEGSHDGVSVPMGRWKDK